MRSYSEAAELAANRVTEIASHAGGRTRRVMFLRDGKDVVARMYRTDIVTWRPDGSVLLDTGGWHTPSTFDGMAAALDVPRSCIGTRSHIPHFNGTPFDGDVLLTRENSNERK